uniref:Aminotransferase class V n=1 Tax=Caulobacter sp. (strain K31) TaxID=366602 RepID=B0T927_CAUSK
MPTRRQSLTALLAAPLAPGLARGQDLGADLLSRSAFSMSGVYLNAAYTHPLPRAGAAALREVEAGRLDPGSRPRPARQSKALFAQLINADPDEIAWIPSTSYGESAIISAMGLTDAPSGRVVTDILHFDGGLYAYGELAKRGLDLVVLPMTAEGRIDMNRLEAAVANGAKLVAVSLVSMLNGFEHDLKTVCEIAHRKGALVYADLVQAAGAVPIDVKASGVDFAACSSFKWLMGDFGCGFLYVRRDRLEGLRHTQFGYHQMANAAYHAFPLDAPGPAMFEYAPETGTAKGRFEVGSISWAAEAAVSVSLKAMIAVGVDQIQARRQPMIDRLAAALGARYRPLTPPGSRSGIQAFSLANARSLQPRLQAARINIQLYANRFRVSPSVYNTPEEIEALIAALAA